MSTIDRTHESIKMFYHTVMLGFEVVNKTNRNKVTTEVISAILSDPRGVISCKNVAFPCSPVQTQYIFEQIKEEFGSRFQIVEFLNDFLNIETTEYGKERANVLSMRQKQFSRAANFYLNRSEDRSKTILQFVQDVHGPLGMHPSYCFLVGVLCYKAGCAGNLTDAYELFEYARSTVLLKPTCVVLQALIMFWGGKCGKFSVLRHEPDPPVEVSEFIHDVVLTKLKDALEVADSAAASVAAVEASLMIDLHAAISMVYFGAAPKFRVESKKHFDIASALHRPFATKRPPPVLLLRAGRALNLNVVGMIHWDVLDQMYAPDSPASLQRTTKELAINKLLWPLLLSTQPNSWDTGALVLELEDRTVTDRITSVDEVTNSWWYKLTTITTSTAVNVRICEHCGSAAERKCGACKKVLYCSKDCQRVHWALLHRRTCGLEF